MAGRVQLFATCLGDLVFPDAVADAEQLLRGAGFEVEFPAGQVCCGQPAFNAGHHKAARRVARTFARAFDRDTPVITPSGSCAAMVAKYLPELLGCEPFPVHELSAFLAANGDNLEPVNAGKRIAYHDSCHMLRELGISDPPRQLLERSGAELVDLPRPDLCCGFGGTFSVRQPEISVAMADEKLAGAREADALVTADPGCLMHLQARASRVGGPPVVHLATALARGSRRVWRNVASSTWCAPRSAERTQGGRVIVITGPTEDAAAGRGGCRDGSGCVSSSPPRLAAGVQSFREPAWPHDSRSSAPAFQFGSVSGSFGTGAWYWSRVMRR